MAIITAWLLQFYSIQETGVKKNQELRRYLPRGRMPAMNVKISWTALPFVFSCFAFSVREICKSECPDSRGDFLRGKRKINTCWCGGEIYTSLSLFQRHLSLFFLYLCLEQCHTPKCGQPFPNKASYGTLSFESFR